MRQWNEQEIAKMYRKKEEISAGNLDSKREKDVYS
jgi:hypothetical protein